VACPAEALLFLSLGVVSVAKMLSISHTLPGFQGGCEVNDTEQRLLQNGERDAKVFFFFYLTYGPKQAHTFSRSSF
jgi:hypothetical protein